MLSVRFQSAPLTEARGDTSPPYWGLRSYQVSIRSPHRSKGRPLRTSAGRIIALFQSAPLTEARGDLQPAAYVNDYTQFQSAPLTEARGDNSSTSCPSTSTRSFNPLPSPKQGETLNVEHVLEKAQVSIRSPHRSKGRHGRVPRRRRYDSVSIRSPHRSKGRLRLNHKHVAGLLFQSAPLTEARGDPAGTTPATCGDSFNPLPSPKQGETTNRSEPSPAGSSFNPLPSPKQGETRQVRRRCPGLWCFNPLPSPKQGETSRCQGSPADYVCFNPLPSPKQGETSEGDAGGVPGRSFNPLPSPKQGETQLGRGWGDGDYVSIRSPHRSKGRPQRLADPRPCLQGFNPLPSPKQGETRRWGKATGLIAVSIRSPHRSKGRRAGNRVLGHHLLFQSAPLTEARGDYPGWLAVLPDSCFNPLPSPKQGETGIQCRGQRGPACFNPLPSPKQGETK